ncbi:dienelactone hydrolase family protein [Pelagicoccus albus]|uniref:Dienelactone hydrolase family protein n=1 Tax=Pelagicoccus albus TaxID=415222 RepID=A0A7X1B6Q0_9BACT|nr:dienelactone hydrolase family protein [Pelagicoccus albus]MBC2605398.1 dienelactone hydrolase family protein [Pelagicoccus albus]
MKLILSLLATFALTSGSAFAEHHFEKRVVLYELDGVTFESTIVYEPDNDEVRPGILMVPNWMGPTEASLEKAMKMAGDDYFVMMVDMYGTDTRPTNGSEAGAAAGKLRSDRNLMRARAAKALEVFKAEAAPLGLNVKEVAAAGFCFGGGTVLELGRTGESLDAIVSFHGDLISPTLEADAAKTTAKVLVLHGADDPYVSQEDVETFVSTMQDTEVDWQLVQYSDTVHSFTNPEANSDGSRYNPTSSKRAFAAMHNLLEELWDE